MADIQMPQLGETVTEGTITKWFKAVGDQVAEDEPLFEVSTDKVDSEVPVPGGRLPHRDQGARRARRSTSAPCWPCVGDAAPAAAATAPAEPRPGRAEAEPAAEAPAGRPPEQEAAEPEPRPRPQADAEPSRSTAAAAADERRRPPASRRPSRRRRPRPRRRAATPRAWCSRRSSAG